MRVELVPLHNTPRASLAPAIIWGHKEKMTFCEPKSSPSSDTKSTRHFDLQLSSLQKRENKFLLFVSHPVYDTYILSAQMD